MNVKDTEIKEILQKYKKITVVGISPDAEKPSQKVPQFMKSKGYQIVGVRPNTKEVAGFPCYNSVHELPPEWRSFINVFRAPEHIPALVDELIKAGGVDVLWLQLGISHPEAEKRAQAAGIRVVSDKCLHLEFQKFFG